MFLKYILKTWAKRQVTWSFFCQELGANIELLIHQACTLSKSTQAGLYKVLTDINPAVSFRII